MDSASDRDERAGAAFGRRDAVRAAFRRWRATIVLPPRARWRRLGREWLADQLAAETRARTGFLLVPLGLMIGVALVHGAGWAPNVWLTILAAIASLCLALRRVGRPVLHPMLILAGFTFVGTALAIGESQRTETTILSGQATVRIAGPVVSRERTEDGRYRYVIAVAETERPVLSRPPERVRIVVGSRHEPISPGGLYRGLVRLGPPSGPAPAATTLPWRRSLPGSEPMAIRSARRRPSRCRPRRPAMEAAFWPSCGECRLGRALP